MDITPIAPGFAVAPQVRVEDMPRLAAEGYRGIVNTRPDGEAPEQPTSDELEAAAATCGLAYRHIPFAPGELTDADAAALNSFLEKVDGPILGFCRTGNRATALWKRGRQLLGEEA
jgi:sulfide:quinone oxidoreductase